MFNKSEKKAPFSKALHTFVDMEHLKPNEMYAFTLNPVKVPYNKDSNVYYSYIQTWMADIQETLNKEKNITYSLYLEFSSTGKPHFHGYISIKDPFVFTVFNTQKLMPLGAICMKPIIDEDWNMYVTKQTLMVKPWCDKHKIPYPMTDKSPIVHPLKLTDKGLQFVEDYSDIE